MKDSGIKWIGEIPENWGVVLLSSVFHQHKEKNSNLRETNLLSLSYGKIIQKDINTCEGLLPASFETYNIIDEGDIVFRLTDLQNDQRSLRTGICTQKGIITSAYVTIRKNVELNCCYMHYLYYSYDICKVFYGMGDGVRQGMNFDDLKSLLTVFAPLQEQQKIADFLDDKCAKIDNLIAHEAATIEELKAYKQSVITEAVTKGLDKTVPMKDSGVEWIGNIPTHWSIDRLKNILSERNEKNDPIKTTERLSLSIDLGVTLYSDKTTNLDRFKDDFSQYKIAHPNDLVLNSMNMIVGAVGVSSFYGCVSPAYYVLYSKTKKVCMSKYFYYLFKSKTLNRFLYSIGKGIYAIERGDDRVNTCRLKVSRDDLNNLLFPIPPYEEMVRIIKKIEEIEMEIDNLIIAKQQKIEELKEYKKSLIYEYVTGKKEVA